MVEIIMFPGRSADMKENLFHSVTKIIKNHTGLKEEDILITISESERYNWAKGGIALSKVDLGY
jgi:4-oxalocrotonate tautomerase family enzyme